MFSDFLAVKAALLHGFPQRHILVVGDLMLDRYLWGSATRISPEAPVPVVRLGRETSTLGGAANVASNLRALGVQASLAGVVGCDAAGDAFRRGAQAIGIDDAAILGLEGRPTISKTRVMADEHQLLRLDEEVTTPLADSDVEQLLGVIERALDQTRTDAVVLSDYAKGVCTPRLCQGLIALCHGRKIPVYVDPKGTNYAKYAGAEAIKPNRVEMIDLARAMGWPTDPVQAAVRLRETLVCRFVAVTLGADGIAVAQDDGVRQTPTVAREVFDVSGAGDTVIATLVSGIACGLALNDAVALANLAAAVVIRKIGTCPVAVNDLLFEVQAADHSLGLRKLYSIEEMGAVAKAWQAQGLKVAFTNGCFDLLHAGHVRLLQDSAAKADRLIVAINSDDSVTRLKGQGRPLMPERQRVVVLSALEAVDAVVVFEEDTPLNAIETIRPDILIKGGDYTVETVVGTDVVQSYGGTVMLVPLVEGLSTTRLADAIAKL